MLGAPPGESSGGGDRQLVTLQCPHCGRSGFKGKGGLGVHIAGQHREARDAAVAAQLKEKKTLWGDEELRIVATLELEAEAEMPSEGVRKYIHDRHASRSLDAIASLRKQARYKTILEEVRVAGAGQGCQARSTRVTRSRTITAPPVSELHVLEDVIEEPVEAGGNEVSEQRTEWRKEVWKAMLKSSRGLCDKLVAPLSAGEAVPEVSAEMCAQLDPLYQIWFKDRSGQMQRNHRKGRKQPRFGRIVSTTKPKSSRAVSKAAERYDIQSLWVKSPSEAIRRVLSGPRPEDPITPEEKRQYWSTVFGSKSIADNRQAECQPKQWEIASPISEPELRAALSSARGTAAGPDGVRADELLRTDLSEVVWWCNAVMLLGRRPSSWYTARTTLIPKVPEPTSPADYRPITVSNVIVRALHGVIAKRLRMIPSTNRQKAYKAVDGCAENVFLVRGLIRRATQQRKELNLLFLDVRKAFDSVSHESLKLVTQKVGIPGPVRELVEDVYRNAATLIEGGTEPARFHRGILQGDPMSGELFNYCMDWAAEAIPDHIRVREGDQMVSHRLYADDMFVCAETRRGLQILLDKVSSALASMGLVLNHAKCRSLRIAIDRVGKRWVADPTSLLAKDGEEIQGISVSQAYKYLGTRIGCKSQSSSALADGLKKGLRALSTGGLKPQQKLYGLRVHLLPSLYHEVTLGDVRMGDLRDLDKTMRAEVRRWLHLPQDTPTAFIHAHVKDGGLGIPSLASHYRSHRHQRLLKMFVSKDPIVKAVAQELEESPGVRQARKGFALGETQISRPEMVRFAWKRELASTCDGKGICPPGTEPSGAGWITNPWLKLSGGEYVKALHVRLNALDTGERRSRGRPGVQQKCTSCPDKVESLGHILQVCMRSHGNRTTRHDKLVRDIVKGGQRGGWTFCVEPRIPHGGTCLKPDLIAVRGDRVIIADPSIVADRFPLQVSVAQKKQLYDVPTVRNFATEMAFSLGARSPLLSVEGLIVSWRGDWSAASFRVLKELGLTITMIHYLTVRSLVDSWHMWRVLRDRTR